MLIYHDNLEIKELCTEIWSTNFQLRIEFKEYHFTITESGTIATVGFKEWF